MDEKKMTTAETELEQAARQPARRGRRKAQPPQAEPPTAETAAEAAAEAPASAPTRRKRAAPKAAAADAPKTTRRRTTRKKAEEAAAPPPAAQSEEAPAAQAEAPAGAAAEPAAQPPADAPETAKPARRTTRKTTAKTTRRKTGENDSTDDEPGDKATEKKPRAKRTTRTAKGTAAKTARAARTSKAAGNAAPEQTGAPEPLELPGPAEQGGLLTPAAPELPPIVEPELPAEDIADTQNDDPIDELLSGEATDEVVLVSAPEPAERPPEPEGNPSEAPALPDAAKEPAGEPAQEEAGAQHVPRTPAERAQDLPSRESLLQAFFREEEAAKRRAAQKPADPEPAREKSRAEVSPLRRISFLQKRGPAFRQPPEPPADPEPIASAGAMEPKIIEQDDPPAQEPVHEPEHGEDRAASITRTAQLSIRKISEDASPFEILDSEPVISLTEVHEHHGSRFLRRIVWWLALVVGMVAAISLGGICWLYYKATPDLIPSISVTLDGEIVTPMSYDWQVPVAGRLLKRTYAENLLPSPLELSDTFGGGTMNLQVSSSSELSTALTVTDAAGQELFSGSAQDFASYSFDQNGTYTIKLVVSPGGGYQSDQSVTGSQTYSFTFHVNVRAVVRLNTQTTKQGGVASVRVTSPMDEAISPGISTSLPHTEFYAVNDAGTAWVAYLPIAYDTEPGSYEIQVEAGGDAQTVTLTVDARTEKSADYSSQYELVSPYVGQEDTPSEVTDLFTNIESTLYFESTGFASPFTDSMDVVLEYGTTEYVGRTQEEKNENTGTGRTSTNVVLSGWCGLVAPAGGVVQLARYLYGTGYTVVIEHGAGIKTIYYNLNGIYVSEGSTVSQGDSLGSTGNRTVVEVRIGATAVEPLSILRGECDALRSY